MPESTHFCTLESTLVGLFTVLLCPQEGTVLNCKMKKKSGEMTPLILFDSMY